MFSSQCLLSRNGPLGAIWVAAYFYKKLKRSQVSQIDISSSVGSLLLISLALYLVFSYFGTFEDYIWGNEEKATIFICLAWFCTSLCKFCFLDYVKCSFYECALSFVWSYARKGDSFVGFQNQPPSFCLPDLFRNILFLIFNINYFEFFEMLLGNYKYTLYSILDGIQHLDPE